MQFLTQFQPPDELDMLERGFELDDAHDPEECVLAYKRTYSDAFELRVQFNIGHPSSIKASITCAGRCISETVAEGVLVIEFQSWHGDGVIRARFDKSFDGHDMRVHYRPEPAIHFASLQHDA